MYRKLTENQQNLLQRVYKADQKGNWYLDPNAWAHRILVRLENRGLVARTGEGEHRWREYWTITEAGKNALDALRPEFTSEVLADVLKLAGNV